MAHRELRLSQNFIEDLQQIYSPKVLGLIKNVLRDLLVYPEMGAQSARPSLVERFGPNIRKVPISTFVLLHRLQGSHDEIIEVLGLIYGPRGV